MRKKYNLLTSIISILVLVAIDQATKWTAYCCLDANDTVIFIPHILSFKLAFNTGAAWGILEGQRFVLTLISLLAVIAVGYFGYKTIDFKNKKLYSIAIVLILGGTLGNLIDRAFYPKGVIDFINFEFMTFPIFNFADSCLTIGMVLLIIYVLFIYKEPKKDVVTEAEKLDNEIVDEIENDNEPTQDKENNEEKVEEEVNNEKN